MPLRPCLVTKWRGVSDFFLMCPFFFPRLSSRHFVTRQGRRGMKRHYWQPTQRLKDNGWECTRLSDDRAAAIREAELLNYRLDEWREGLCGLDNLPRTLGELIKIYKRSDNFTNLKPNTTRRYNQNIKNIIEHFGTPPKCGRSPRAKSSGSMKSENALHLSGHAMTL